eukprot:TRINITY_DN11629_c0_g1_i1.p1 TRINITY_DN11629_c0_g1~~TRINITY_DN11629_c0_g1_i1.p1  ORF type:complete len:258 (+),score=32.09 TRINITY_DN11629_c0_g1_i1:604-1377(+)
MFSETDYYHLRRDVGKRAVAEIIKAVRRTAIRRNGQQYKDHGIVLVLAAGWNVDNYTYCTLDRTGKAWLRAEIVASAELCSLDGHPVSAFMKKLRELVDRTRRNHYGFLRQSIGSIMADRPSDQLQQGMMRKRLRSEAGSFTSAKACKHGDGESFPFAGSYIGNWYGKDQEVVIYQDWTYTVPGYVDRGRVSEIVPKSDAPSSVATYCLVRSDKGRGKHHYFCFLGSRAYGAYDPSCVPRAGTTLWTLRAAEPFRAP